MTKTAEAKLKAPESTYWICDQCAALHKWIAPAHGVTVIRGVCGYCNGPETTLTPIVNYRKEKS